MPSKAAPQGITALCVADEQPPNSGESQLADQTRASRLFAESWPPVGWPMFACVTRPSGTVMGTERNAHGDQTLLKYEASVSENGLYTVEIFKGAVTRAGEFSLSPAISFQFSGREDWYEKQPENAVRDISVNGQSLLPEHGVVLRTILAITFLISRIDRGLAPNLKKTLKLYRLG